MTEAKERLRTELALRGLKAAERLSREEEEKPQARDLHSYRIYVLFTYFFVYLKRIFRF